MGKDSDPSSDYSQTGNTASDDVSNRSGGGYQDKDAATETNAGGRETARAWHDARSDADVRDQDK